MPLQSHASERVSRCSFPLPLVYGIACLADPTSLPSQLHPTFAIGLQCFILSCLYGSLCLRFTEQCQSLHLGLAAVHLPRDRFAAIAAKRPSCYAVGAVATLRKPQTFTKNLHGTLRPNVLVFSSAPAGAVKGFYNAIEGKP